VAANPSGQLTADAITLIVAGTPVPARPTTVLRSRRCGVAESAANGAANSARKMISKPANVRVTASSDGSYLTFEGLRVSSTAPDKRTRIRLTVPVSKAARMRDSWTRRNL
jgi:hypothetical protein